MLPCGPLLSTNYAPKMFELNCVTLNKIFCASVLVDTPKIWPSLIAVYTLHPPFMSTFRNPSQKARAAFEGGKREDAGNMLEMSRVYLRFPVAVKKEEGKELGVLFPRGFIL